MPTFGREDAETDNIPQKKQAFSLAVRCVSQPGWGCQTPLMMLPCGSPAVPPQKGDPGPGSFTSRHLLFRRSTALKNLESQSISGGELGVQLLKFMPETRHSEKDTSSCLSGAGFASCPVPWRGSGVLRRNNCCQPSGFKLVRTSVRVRQWPSPKSVHLNLGDPISARPNLKSEWHHTNMLKYAPYSP